VRQYGVNENGARTCQLVAGDPHQSALHPARLPALPESRPAACTQAASHVAGDRELPRGGNSFPANRRYSTTAPSASLTVECPA
jgi:hypothetical protein